MGGNLDKFTVTVDGVTYTGRDELVELNLTTGAGIYLQGPNDATLALAQEGNGFKVTAATDSRAATYTISIGLYSSLKAGGTLMVYVSETFSASDFVDGSYTTKLQDYMFVDQEWGEENANAVRGTDGCGNVTYTLNGETYYLIENDTMEIVDSEGNHVPRAATIFSVTVYDENGNNIASASL